MLNYYKSYYLPFEFEKLRQYCIQELLCLMIGFFFFLKEDSNLIHFLLLVILGPYILYIKYAYLNYSILNFRKNLKYKILIHILIVSLFFILSCYSLISDFLFKMKDPFIILNNFHWLYFIIIIFVGILKKIQIYQILKKKNYLWNRTTIDIHSFFKLKEIYSNFIKIYVNSIIHFRYFFILYFIYLGLISYSLFYLNPTPQQSMELNPVNNYFSFSQNKEKDTKKIVQKPIWNIYEKQDRLSKNDLSFQSIQKINAYHHFIFIWLLMIGLSCLTLYYFERIDYSVLFSGLLANIILWIFSMHYHLNLDYSSLDLIMSYMIFFLLVQWGFDFIHRFQNISNSNPSIKEFLYLYYSDFFKQKIIYIPYFISLISASFLFEKLNYQNLFIRLSLIFLFCLKAYPIMLSVLYFVNEEASFYKQKFLNFWQSNFSKNKEYLLIFILLINHIYILYQVLLYAPVNVNYLFLLLIFPYWLTLLITKKILFILKLRKEKSIELNIFQRILSSKTHKIYNYLSTKHLSTINFLISLCFLIYSMEQPLEIDNNLNHLSNNQLNLSKNINQDNVLIAIENLDKLSFLKQMQEFKKHPLSKIKSIEFIQEDHHLQKKYLIFLLNIKKESSFQKMSVKKQYLEDFNKEINFILNALKKEYPNYSFLIYNHKNNSYQILAEFEDNYRYFFMLIFIAFTILSFFLKKLPIFFGIFLLSPFLTTYMLFNYFSIQIPLLFFIYNYIYMSFFICILFEKYYFENLENKSNQYLYFFTGYILFIVFLLILDIGYYYGNLYSFCLFLSLFLIDFKLLSPYLSYKKRNR